MSSIVCRAKDPATCRIHGNSFASTIDVAKGTFLPNAANNSEKTFKASQNFALLLTPEEKEILSKYAAQEYTQINQYLHGDLTAEDKSEAVELLDNAIKRYQKVVDREPLVTYRATKIYEQQFTSRKDAESYIKENFKPGSIIEMKGFSSTSTNPEALFDFLPQSYEDITPSKGIFGIKNREEYLEMNNNVDRGLGNLVYEINSKSGVPISSFGQHYAVKEQEYLLGRGSKFKVVDVVFHTKLVNPKEDAHPSVVQKHATVVRLQELV